MKILLINDHHYIKGGAERYYFDLAELLESKGHEVAFFSMKDRRNIKTKWEKYFMDNLDLEKTGFNNMFKKSLRMFYSFEAKRKVGQIMDNFKPDIVHINNIYYYISPSILGEINKRGVPIVQTVHDYQLISPITNLFFNGRITEVTKKNKYYKALFDRKENKNYMAPIMSIIASYTQHIFKFHERYVDLFITPGVFMKRKLAEYGFDGKKIISMHYFVKKQKEIKSKSKDKFILYFGRIDEYKGILLILRLAEECPEIKIKIIGSYANKKIEKQIKDFLKKGQGNLEVIKHLERRRLNKYISDSCFVVTPSIWYEVQCFSLMEAFVLSKTAVVSKIGGMQEIVKDKRTGLFFNPENYTDFKNKVRYLWRHDSLAKKLGRAARIDILKSLSAEDYYRKLMKLYKAL